MTILSGSRPQLWSREVPGGWRIVNIRQGASITPYYLSPEGHRFSSLQAVRSHVATFKPKRTELKEAEEVSPGTEKSDKKRKRKRKRTRTCEGSVAKRLRLEEEEEASNQPEVPDLDLSVDLSIPPEIQKRRKLMALRSPFRNLLKRTLVRNHIRMKGRMTMMIPKAEVVKRDKPSQCEGNNSPPSKRRKLDTIPAPKDREDCSSYSELKTEKKSEENLLSTPPRKIKREMHIFPPPNLTPPVVGPVVRRPKTISFSQPNQRNILTRKVAVNVKNVSVSTVRGRGEAQ